MALQYFTKCVLIVDFRANDYEASGSSYSPRKATTSYRSGAFSIDHQLIMVKLYYFENQRYSKLKAQCERNESLFVDPVFPPETKSLYFSRATPPEPVEWKRPKVKSAVKLSF